MSNKPLIEQEWEAREYPYGGGLEGTYWDVDELSEYGPTDEYSVMDGMTEEQAKAIAKVPEMISILKDTHKVLDQYDDIDSHEIRIGIEGIMKEAEQEL